MDITSAFPSDYLRHQDLNGQDHTLIMERVEMGKVGDDEKPVLYFRGAKKGLALNKTNSRTIADIYGTETNNWAGQSITLGTAWVDFQGKQVPAIRVRPQVRQPGNVPGNSPPPVGANFLPNAVQQEAAQQEVDSDNFDQDIPF